MHQLLSSLFLLTLLSGCALFSPNKDDHTYLYLNDMAPASTSSDQYKSALSRDLSMAGGFYEVSAFPVVVGYVKAQAREQSSLRGLSQKQHQQILSKLKEEFIDDKLCFTVSYQALRFDKVSHLKNWKVFFQNPKGESIPLSWHKEDLNKEPIKGKVMKSGDNLDSWSGSGTACTTLKTELSNGFALKVMPDYVQFPFDSTAEVYWEFPEMVEKEGKKVWKEEKKKSFKGYRGW
ncbi:MAG: hypothetical protein VXV96_15520 [Bdellovibrionota bacterium]|jgi:hypothetical protein|nr:hypothetical protein [Bdellovibrionota bacterium]